MFRFVFFLIYTMSIFFIHNWIILSFLFLINILLTFFVNVDIKQMLENFLILLPFVLLTVFINILFENFNFGFLIGIRLFMCYNITCVFSKIFSVMEFAKIVEKMCFPLKLFKINTKNIGIMISIGICMIPIFKVEIHELVKAMNSKGKKLKIKNIGILMKPVLIQTFRKTNQLEKTLISKGYVD